MTEAEWQVCTDPGQMIAELGDRFSPRKTRLYACAWAWSESEYLQDERSFVAVETAERFADGRATVSELTRAHSDAAAAWHEIPEYDPSGSMRGARQSEKGRRVAKAAARLALLAADPELNPRRLPFWGGGRNKLQFQLAEVLRDLFGSLLFRPCPIDPAWVRWNGEAGLALARTIDAERAFEYTPILADALEDAGCESTDLLDHLRGGTVHHRGCWVVDALLGKQ